MATLSHATNPFLKQEILNRITEFIYSAAEKRIQIRLEELVTKNTAMTGTGDLAFSYKGELYMCEGVRRTTWKTNRLLPVLKPYMDEWLNDQSILRSENDLINSYLACVLNSSNNVSDYFRLFPDCLHSALQSFTKFRDVHKPISDEQVQAIHSKNQKAVSLIKQRLLLNIIV